MRILIIVDMQNDFITGALGSEGAQELVPRVCKKIDEFDGVVLATMDTHGDNYSSTKEGRAVPPHCVNGSWGRKIQSDIMNSILEKPYEIIKKSTYGSIELISYLKQYYDTAPTEVTLVGIQTDRCVIANAILVRSFFPEWDVIVDSSCCAGSTPSNHKAALDVMEACGTEVV